MAKSSFRHIYGPVLSRRLGHSLGVDLVHLKTCTYDCIYCQLGRTTHKTIERREYVAVAEILNELKNRLALSPALDYISLAGSGEPTLNIRVGDLLEKIKGLVRVPVAVITNGSLLWMREVQDALMEADLVIPSLDAGDGHSFGRINRPHPAIGFESMVDGLAEFRERFKKPIWLEVFLLAGLTDSPREVKKIAALAKRIRPHRVQLNTVARPPCENYARPILAKQLETFAAFFKPPAEVIGENIYDRYFGNSDSIVDADIMGLLCRRPCRAVEIAAGLGVNINVVAKRLQVLMRSDSNIKTTRDGCYFYVPGPGVS